MESDSQPRHEERADFDEACRRKVGDFVSVNIQTATAGNTAAVEQGFPEFARDPARGEEAQYTESRRLSGTQALEEGLERLAGGGAGRCLSSPATIA